MNALLDFLREFAGLVFETAPYLLIGFLVAGLLKVFLPARAVQGHLGKNNLRSVFKAALYGIPIPLCSCSVIPTATSLRKSGASKGATASFLISTPETGVDSISVTWALLDPVMTVVRPVIAFVAAVFTGGVVNFLVRRGWDSKGALDEPKEPEPEACCSEHAEGSGEPFLTRLKEAIRYAYGPLMDDLSTWLILGFAISAAISVITPDSFFADTVPAGLPAMLLMLVVAMPFYICATGSTPIAAALIAKGLDPGAALVFLLVGPATNATTMIVVARLLGKRALFAYLLGIGGFAILAGGWVNSYYTQSGIDLAQLVSLDGIGEPGWISTLSGLVFFVLLYRSARRLRLGKPLGGRLALAAGLVLYSCSAFTLILPGEEGWVMRFGGVARNLEQPGLYFHWPFPIDRAEVVRPEDVRSLAVGYDPSAEIASREIEEASETMTGDGTLLRVTYAVHYSWSDPYTVRFAIDDPDELTRVFSESALRQIVAGKTSSALLVEERESIAHQTRMRLQAELDGIGSGIRITSLNVREVHAPPDVHYAYRDVASALEDKERSSHDAARDRAKLMAEAVASSYEEVKQAEIERDAVIREAEGKGTRFLAQRDAYREFEQVSRMRLRLEAIEEVLRSARAFVLLGADVQLDLLNVDTEQSRELEALLQMTNPRGTRARETLGEER